MVASHAQSAPSPKAFVQHVYARYAEDKSGSRDMVLGRDAAQVFSPGLLRLMKRDQARAGTGYVGALDFDPVCSCQESDGMHIQSIAISLLSPTKATATVRLRFPQPATKLVHLKLVLRPDGWRIDEISSDGASSLRALLK